VTVSELIQKLKEMPQDADIEMEDDRGQWEVTHVQQTSDSMVVLDAWE
jgi:hypothetical protein